MLTSRRDTAFYEILVTILFYALHHATQVMLKSQVIRLDQTLRISAINLNDLIKKREYPKMLLLSGTPALTGRIS